MGDIKANLSVNIPYGWLLCDGRKVSRTEYSALFNVIGTKFGNGDKINTFNVPDLRDRFLQGANGNLGTVKEAGLPNITGSFFVFTRDNYSSGSAMKDANGAFYLSTKNGICGNGGESNLSADSNTCNIDASRSNSIYGKSNTVQPNSVCVNYIIKAK